MNQMEYKLTKHNQEQVAYDSVKMPLYIREGQLKDYPNLAHICHWHEDLEFLYVTEGHMTYFINGSRYLIREEEGIFVNARQLHYGYSADGTDSRFFCLLLNPLLLCANTWIEETFILPVVNHDNFSAAVLSQDVLWHSELLELLCRARTIYEEQLSGFELDLQSCFYQILLRLFRNMPAKADGPARDSAKLSCLKQMIHFIEQGIQQKITLSDVAASGGVCVSSCCKLFRQYVNCTPMEYLTQCRLQLGCELLRETELSITDIAYQIGFMGASYFSERFRQQYGCSPKEFRVSTKILNGADTENTDSSL